MRERNRIIGSLESLYQTTFAEAQKREDQAEMARLDFGFQRDQLYLEVLLDVRDLLAPPEESGTEKAKSLLEKAQALKRITKLR